MVDVSDKWACNKLDFEVLKCLTQYPDVPAVLVLNKVQLIHHMHANLILSMALSIITDHMC
jgi:hypothetical protein